MHRDFHIGDILSVTTGCLVSPRMINGVYDILNFMTGESLFTHQLPRVCGEAVPVILRQHPQLANVCTEGVDADSWRGWLDARIAEFGEMLPIERMTVDEHERIDALSELAEKVSPDRIIVVGGVR